MVAEHIAPTVVRSHGSDAGAESQSPRFRAAVGATTAVPGGDPTAAATADAAASSSGLNSHKCSPNRWGKRRPLAKLAWQIKTVVSGMNGDLAEVSSAAETGGVRNAEEKLKD